MDYLTVQSTHSKTEKRLMGSTCVVCITGCQLCLEWTSNLSSLVWYAVTVIFSVPFPIRIQKPRNGSDGGSGAKKEANKQDKLGFNGRHRLGANKWLVSNGAYCWVRRLLPLWTLLFVSNFFQCYKYTKARVSSPNPWGTHSCTFYSFKYDIQFYTRFIEDTGTKYT